MRYSHKRKPRGRGGDCRGEGRLEKKVITALVHGSPFRLLPSLPAFFTSPSLFLLALRSFFACRVRFFQSSLSSLSFLEFFCNAPLSKVYVAYPFSLFCCRLLNLLRIRTYVNRLVMKFRISQFAHKMFTCDDRYVRRSLILR